MYLTINKIVIMKLPTKYSKLDWTKGEKAKVREEYIKLQKGLCYLDITSLL